MGAEGQAASTSSARIWLYRPDGTDLRPTRSTPGLQLHRPDRRARRRPGTLERNWSPGELGARTVEVLDLAYRSSASGGFETRDPT